MRTVKQTFHVQQHQTYQQQYQQQGHQIDGFQQQALQQPQQQSVQYQTSQQTSSSAFHQMPAHRQHPTPAQTMPSVFQNGSPAPPQAHTAPAPGPAPAPAAAPARAPVPVPAPNLNAPQYANQNGTVPPHAAAPQEGDPEPANILPQYQAPPGYSTAYTAVHGEWPPKVNLGPTPTNPPPQPTKNENAPNMTTTYPSGFKLRERAPVEQAPARVVMSQPAFKMTQPIKKPGDSKWPPKGNMEPTQEEVREFIKPRKSNKDYSEFFAQNALPHNYAGYRPPPGTQHHGLLEEGVSNM
ncbi:LOW QUALITY PROTEIN: leucine-rich repeat extensin-like protein 2 [Penaeus chinensis]|uniref:LOW QUALITY PROTEIN: leucine-rich repeat extensin-like protein 2 n=1 Tax=Penaeus chinensis TaxID=139456 RepID=UPI001FB75E21|nr:LOW QUALITY PROTEIN: leucine-rich repeat extensin-like protein 2 [Penaeus chinensis]